MSYGVGKTRRQGKADHWVDVDFCFALMPTAKLWESRHDQAVSLKDGQSDEEHGQANLDSQQGNRAQDQCWRVAVNHRTVVDGTWMMGLVGLW